MTADWIFFGTSALITATLGWPVVWFLLRMRIVDRPGERSSHQEPTARGGGLAIVVVILGGGVWLAARQGGLPVAWILLALLLLAGVSFWDDLRSLGPALRFGCHTAAALLALAGLGWPVLALALSPDVAWGLPSGLGLVLSLIWLTGYTNAFNFMDGINGLAAFQAMLAGAGSGFLGGLASGRWDTPSIVFAWIVAGAAAGFLPHNFPKARVFMGDVGSASLGFLLAALVLWIARDLGWWLLVPLMLLHTNFVLDTGITLVRRIARGEKWFRPHREHFYQRLLRSGRSHVSVTLLEAAIQIFVLGLLVVYLYVGVPAKIGIVAIVFGLWGVFFFQCEQAFRATGSPALPDSVAAANRRAPIRPS